MSRSKLLLITQTHSIRSIIFTLILVISLGTSTSGISGELILKKGDRVAILGDSITQQKKYSRFIEMYLLTCVPELELSMFQFGWSGETASRFAIRMDDYLLWQPTVATICYGMNDGRYVPYTDKIGADYRAAYSRILSRSKDAGIRMIIAGPGCVGSDTFCRKKPEADVYYNDNLGRLSIIAGEEAKKNGFAFANIHPLMMQIMISSKKKYGEKYSICGGDGVHPASSGHLIMAYTFLKAMGLDGAIGTVTLDMTGGATATDGHSVISASNGKVKIESSRYPFCFSGKMDSPKKTNGILEFLPFNQDLNRYMLVVKNLTAPTAEVKWGETTKTFTKAELAAGINLADEFRENPFTARFFIIDRLVSLKQTSEIKMIKTIITNYRWISSMFPEDEEANKALEVLRKKFFQHNSEQMARVRRAVKPITHVIQVTPKG